MLFRLCTTNVKMIPKNEIKHTTAMILGFFGHLEVSKPYFLVRLDV